MAHPHFKQILQPFQVACHGRCMEADVWTIGVHGFDSAGVVLA
jgi:hypothetical protein